MEDLLFKMKIIQIMPEFALAGAETMCENLTYELISNGDDVIVVSMYDYHSPITERLESKNISVKYLSKKPGIDLSIILKLISLFRDEKPDVVHTHRYVMQYVIPAAVISGITIRVHTVHNIAIKENDKPARVLAKFFYKFMNVVPVALSKEIQKTIIDEYKIDEKKIPIIFNGVDLRKCNVKNSYSYNETFKICHIGRFSYQKNHALLVNAFEKFHRKYENTELWLIGEGEKENEIKQLVAEKHIDDAVKFMGVTDNVYPYLHKADVFTLSSFYEGLPMTLIEAMGTGLPIVITNVGGIPDILTNNEDALLVEVDIEQMRIAFERLYESIELRSRIGSNAKIVATKYSSQNMGSSYHTLYEELNNKD